MERKINMFMATEAEYRRGLAHKLLNEGVIDFCLAAVNPYTHLPEKDDRIVTVNTVGCHIVACYSCLDYILCECRERICNCF